MDTTGRPATMPAKATVPAAALRIWSAAKISDAIDRVRRAERATMAPANAGTVLSDAAMLGVARMAARQRG